MKKLLLFILLSAVLSNFLKAQNLHRVNNNTDFDADFTTLQDAVTAASNGDTIYVEGSATDYAGATINKPLTIVGPGFFLNENPKTQANNVAATFNGIITFAAGSEGSTIMGCKMQSGYNLIVSVSDITVIRNNLYYLDFNSTSNNIVVAQNWMNGIDTPNGQITNAIISNNIIYHDIDMNNTSGSLIVSNNVFRQTSQDLSH